MRLVPVSQETDKEMTLARPVCRHLLLPIGAIAIAAVALVLVSRCVQPPSEDKLYEQVISGRYDAVERALHSRSHKIRINAVLALGRVGSDQSVRLLAGAINDESIPVRLALVRTLENLSDRHAMSIIKHLLSDEEVTIVYGSIMDVQRRTDVQYGYDPYSDAGRRKLAIEKCRTDIDRLLAVARQE